MIRTAFAAAALLLAAGCSGNRASYPSLGVRPVEKMGFAEPEPAVVKVVNDPALDSRIAEFGKRLESITTGFAADAAKADAAAKAARGQPVGTDAWIEAQTALSALDDRRAQTSALATDVEQAAIDRAATLAPAYPALQALSDRIVAEGARQSQEIGRIQSGLVAA